MSAARPQTPLKTPPETIKPFAKAALAAALPGALGLALARGLADSGIAPAALSGFGGFCAGLLVVGPPLAFFAARRRAAARKRREEARRALLEAVARHRAALTRNLRRAVKTNDYGRVTADKTDEALEEFFASVALDRRLIPFAEAAQLVSAALEPPKPRSRGARRFDPQALPADGHAFERWVAEALAGFGWEAETTPGSGDQGLDVIARRKGRSLGIQCKLYGSAIGNRAVQEAHAGKAFHRVEAAAVLSNAPFTPGARDLALATGVRLFSPQDIPELYEKTFGRGRKSA